ncbi:RhoGEF Rgf3 [Schizosaccharomyces cryophilus OY26]|uniref:RhoGEF Rgf3 n=1 Tax=Schizosaccharomyces cryophilus (strain OY26 / ATCC MYA-4695 / CBS 11777 / NBRC 106824 / NRRL Y48691) TaxID=653667 RepID=S9VRQ7_SCHCR|nr:RhoGEF Rgf3 [Schizosaccharomyces cryophilus OY26]EPY50613.1 RhoGEF Rgf3 [Schizosaccharomyces cryophilus OY26]
MKLSNDIFRKNSRDERRRKRTSIDYPDDFLASPVSTPNISPVSPKRLSISDFSSFRLFSSPFNSPKRYDSTHSRQLPMTPQSSRLSPSRRTASYTVRSSPALPTTSSVYSYDADPNGTVSSFPNALHSNFSPSDPLDTDPYLMSPGGQYTDVHRPLPETPSPTSPTSHPLPRPPLLNTHSNNSSPYSSSSSNSFYTLYNELPLSFSPEPYLPLSPTRSPSRSTSPFRTAMNEADNYSLSHIDSFGCWSDPSFTDLTSSPSPANFPSPSQELHISRELPKVPVQQYTSGEISSPLVSRSSRATQANALFSSCREPWSLKRLFSWCKEEVFPALSATTTDGAPRQEVAQIMAILFTMSVASMDFLIAEVLAKNIISDWIQNGYMKVTNLEKLYITFVDDQFPSSSGVLPILTNGGCYSYTCRSKASSSNYTCYSCRCVRIPAHRLTSTQGDFCDDSWNMFWNLSPQDSLPSSLTKKEVARQNNIHELICKESDYVADLHTLAELFRDGIVQENSIVPSNRVADFIQSVFGNVESIRQLHSQFILPQLIIRERLQGPVVSLIGDILLEWIQMAKVSYINYAKQFPLADETYKLECQRNTYFARWLATCRSDPRCRRLDFQHFLQRPTQRLQRYTLEWDTILKHTDPTSWDYQLISQAEKELRATCEECDAVIATVLEANRIRDLSYQLLFKNHESINLELRDPEREFFFEGPVFRKSESRLDWIEIHIFLLDNYFIMAKPRRDKRTNAMKFLVSKRPIPMDLLVLNPLTEEWNSRNSSNKFLGSLTGNFPYDGSTNVRSKRKSRLNLDILYDYNSDKMNEGSLNTLALEKQHFYPFTVRHLGGLSSTYTLYTESLQLRKLWMDKINFARKRHAQKMHKKSPFALQIVSDVSFQYPPADLSHTFESSSRSPEISLVEGSAVDRALTMAAWRYPIHNEDDLPEAINYGDITCIAQFGGADGKLSICIATTTGVFLGSFGGNSNIREWRKISSHRRVMQIGLLEEFDCLLELRDRSMYAHKLSRVIETGTLEPKVAIPVGTSHNISFFKISKLTEGASIKRERTLIFFKQGSGNASSIHCCEPVVGLGHHNQKAYNFKQKNVSSFRILEEFRVLADCYSMNCFKYSIAISRQKGIDIVRLDPKLAVSFPSPSVLTDPFYRSRLNNSKPLGVFRVHDSTIFACCYHNGALFVNGEGSLIKKDAWLQWIGRPNSVACYEGYLLAFSDDFIEIWNSRSMKQVQVIQGNNIRLHASNSDLLSDGKHVMFSMTHPQFHDRHLILALDLVKEENLMDV